jgi:hypothetical protein
MPKAPKIEKPVTPETPASYISATQSTRPKVPVNAFVTSPKSMTGATSVLGAA